MATQCCSFELLATVSRARIGMCPLPHGDVPTPCFMPVETRAAAAGYSVVRQFVGHGIGQRLHEPPQIPNYGRPGRGPRLLPGMVFAIEPMVNIGTENVRMLDDEWTAVTADGELSGHFEHTVLFTEEGPEILTQIEGSH